MQPTSIPEAQTQLDSSERDLNRQLAVMGPRPSPQPTNDPTTAPRLPTTSPDTASHPAAGASPTPVADQKKEEAAPSDCALVCRALSSMRHAADTICRLDGDQSPRCSDARSRVSRSTDLASRARCSCAD
jgi:hypothetical protein